MYTMQLLEQLRRNLKFTIFSQERLKIFLKQSLSNFFKKLINLINLFVQIVLIVFVMVFLLDKRILDVCYLYKLNAYI